MGCVWCQRSLPRLVPSGLQDIKNRRELLMAPHAKAVKHSQVLNIHGKADETVSSHVPCDARLSLRPLLACLSSLILHQQKLPAAEVLWSTQSARSLLLNQRASGLASMRKLLSTRMQHATIAESSVACRFLLRMHCPSTSIWPRVSWCWWMGQAITSARAPMPTF